METSQAATVAKHPLSISVHFIESMEHAVDAGRIRKEPAVHQPSRFRGEEMGSFPRSASSWAIMKRAMSAPEALAQPAGAMGTNSKSVASNWPFRW